jgi:hypothetical protein
MPDYASYMRQSITGFVDPGRKHEYIVFRYVEETFKNMTNLEIIELKFITE